MKLWNWNGCDIGIDISFQHKIVDDLVESLSIYLVPSAGSWLCISRNIVGKVGSINQMTF